MIGEPAAARAAAKKRAFISSFLHREGLELSPHIAANDYQREGCASSRKSSSEPCLPAVTQEKVPEPKGCWEVPRSQFDEHEIEPTTRIGRPNRKEPDLLEATEIVW
jgi:hypothetical protein